MIYCIVFFCIKGSKWHGHSFSLWRKNVVFEKKGKILSHKGTGKQLETKEDKRFQEGYTKTTKSYKGWHIECLSNHHRWKQAAELSVQLPNIWIRTSLN